MITLTNCYTYTNKIYWTFLIKLLLFLEVLIFQTENNINWVPTTNVNMSTYIYY